MDMKNWVHNTSSQASEYKSETSNYEVTNYNQKWETNLKNQCLLVPNSSILNVKVRNRQSKIKKNRSE